MKDELAKRLVQGLKSAGINFVTYLPETRLSQIVPLIRDDPEMELIAAASEQEAVTIAAGATLGGKCAAVYMDAVRAANSLRGPFALLFAGEFSS